MFFIPIPSAPKALPEKLKKDSNAAVSPWPADAAEVQWLGFEGSALKDLHSWLNVKCAQKVTFESEETDKSRRALGLITAGDYEYYLKVFNIVAPFLTGKPVHPFPKFSAAIAEKALAGFTNPNPAEQPAAFELAENNLTLNGTLTHDHLITVLLTLSGNPRQLQQYSFNIPLDFQPLLVKTFLHKYLTDINYTYAEGARCYRDFNAGQQNRDKE
ncbi:MAG: hypothetical protein JWQ66_3246 [Mucilaginibacter sp.]|nr:hypothetical protein [Mucilaginibacter sp.]